MIRIVQRRKVWFGLSFVLVILSIAALASWGLKLGIDFTGGTLLEVGFNETSLDSQEIRDSLSSFDLGEVNVQFSGDGTSLLRFKEVDEDTHQQILTALNDKAAEKLGVAPAEAEGVTSENADTEGVGTDAIKLEGEGTENVSVEMLGTEETGEEVSAEEGDGSSENLEAVAPTGGRQYVSEKRFDSIGPVIGNELQTSTGWAIAVALVAIVLYIGWAFRKIAYPVSSFKYGIIATIALFHDILITLGVFSVLGHFFGIEVGVSFVAALLTILGYSVNDTIVVFDRTRENLLRGHMDNFEETVNKSVNETIIRSLNTSFTTLLVLFVIYLFGGSSISYFILALIIGISIGTYSSIFIASPLLVAWQQFDLKRKK
ncbi:MAG: protein translocase subunit SecF [Candidatus Pacebacteria bacterium]|nr:protein translocase subunit SecF [Candidatus Paceibacterota bacterium]